MNSDFKAWLKTSVAAKRYAIIAFMLCIAYYVLEYINGRAQMADFRVYYDAANAFLYDTQLYGKSFGIDSAVYKYSPFAALPFIPLAVLPYAIASGIYYLLMTLAFIWWPLYIFYYIGKNQLTFDWKKTGVAVFFSVLFLADHIERELHLGNVNLFLLILCFFVYRALRQDACAKAGTLLGIILLFKPHFAIILPYLVWKGKWKALITTVVTVVGGFLLPVLFKGWQGNIEIHVQWLQAMRDHNMSLGDSPNTIYGIINSFILNGAGNAVLVLLLLTVVAALYIWFLVRNRKVYGNTDVRFMEYFILVAAIPNLAHTDTEHFMWTWPLIVYVIVMISLEGIAQHKFWVFAMALAFIPYCVNSPDIVGHKIRFLFDEGGLLGLSNLIIISTALYFYIQQTKISHSLSQ